jgi:hypothetical protein
LHPAKPKLPNTRQEGNQDCKCDAQSRAYASVFQPDFLASAIIGGSKLGKTNPSRPAARSGAMVAQQNARRMGYRLDIMKGAPIVY